MKSISILCMIGLCSVLGACGSKNSTTGSTVVLHTFGKGDATAASQFTTGFKWNVTLTKAAVAISGLYYFDGPPPTTMLLPRPLTPLERLEKVMGVGMAWAHPGHYQAGTARGQTVPASPITLDALSSTSIDFGDGTGITGPYRSGRVVLPMTAPSDPTLDGHIAIAEGQAVAENADSDAGSPAPIYFRLTADYADISASIQNGAVDGCVLDDGTSDGVDVDVEGNGTITLQVLPRVWVNLVDFSKMSPGTAEAPTETKDAGFSQGVTELSAYHFVFTH